MATATELGSAVERLTRLIDDRNRYDIPHAELLPLMHTHHRRAATQFAAGARAQPRAGPAPSGR